MTRTFRNTNGETHTVPDNVKVAENLTLTRNFVEFYTRASRLDGDGWSEEPSEYQLPNWPGAVVYSASVNKSFVHIDGNWWHTTEMYSRDELTTAYPDLVTKFEGFDA